MSPDDDRPVPLFDDGLEPDLAALASTLEAAGDRARRADDAPSRAFAADLRARLVGAAIGAGPAAAAPTVGPALVDGGPVALDRVRPHVVRRSPPVANVPRWSVAAVAAAVVIAVVGINGRWLQGGPAEASVVGATDAALVRDGARIDLVAGQELRAGDRILTGPDGSATIALAGGEARLEAAADLTITELDHERIRLDQDAGRAWHRVAEPLETYLVTTADVTWTATGTAFDLDRRAAADGGEEVRAIGIEHDVAAAGPDLALSVREGMVALIDLGGGEGRDVQVTEATRDDLRDPWLRWNGARDLALGFEIGVLGLDLALASEAPTPLPSAARTDEPAPSGDASPTVAPSATDASTPVPTAPPTASPTPKPTPTAKPTPTPTPKPTPTPGLASLGLTVTACNGGLAVLDWSMAPADAFDHYQGLRSTSGSIAPVYPPQAPAVAPDGLYAADRTTLRGIDVGLEASVAYAYRAVAFTAGDEAFAASPVKSITAKPVKELGSLDWALVEGSVITEWLAYGGPDACFSVAKLVLSQDDETPSYLEGSTAVWAAEDQAAATATLDGLASGTYFARLEVLRDTWAGKVLVARRGVATIVVP